MVVQKSPKMTEIDLVGQDRNDAFAYHFYSTVNEKFDGDKERSHFTPDIYATRKFLTQVMCDVVGRLVRKS